jgi:hypothetical protein
MHFDNFHKEDRQLMKIPFITPLLAIIAGIALTFFLRGDLHWVSLLVLIIFTTIVSFPAEALVISFFVWLAENDLCATKVQEGQIKPLEKNKKFAGKWFMSYKKHKLSEDNKIVPLAPDEPEYRPNGWFQRKLWSIGIAWIGWFAPFQGIRPGTLTIPKVRKHPESDKMPFADRFVTKEESIAALRIVIDRWIPIPDMDFGDGTTLDMGIYSVGEIIDPYPFWYVHGPRSFGVWETFSATSAAEYTNTLTYQEAVQNKGGFTKNVNDKLALSIKQEKDLATANAALDPKLVVEKSLEERIGLRLTKGSCEMWESTADEEHKKEVAEKAKQVAIEEAQKARKGALQAETDAELVVAGGDKELERLVRLRQILGDDYGEYLHREALSKLTGLTTLVEKGAGSAPPVVLSANQQSENKDGKKEKEGK